jgi:glycosidase
MPTMLDGDERKIRMAYSLMFSLPGTPVLFYGEEIGMGENLKVPGRLAVRTPMHWKPGKTGGFTTAEPRDLIRAVPSGPFSPDNVNVWQQRNDSESMLNWMERLIRRRKETGEFGFGKCTVIEVGNPSVLALSCDWEGRVVITLHNFSNRAQVVDISKEIPDDLLEVAGIWYDSAYPEVGKDGRVDLQPYGYRWLRVLKQGQELLL